MSVVAKALCWHRQGRLIIDKVSGEVSPGRLLMVLGPNGAGKSSLLHLLAGGELPSSGELSLAGRPLAHFSAEQLARQRAVLSQDQPLLFPFVVKDVVAMGGLGGACEGDIRDCLEAFSATGLMYRQYLSLSGGERQRVQLARVLLQLLPAIRAGEQSYLFLDEPLNALDLQHQFALLSLLHSLREQGLAICCVVHDLILARRFADQVWVLAAGRLVAQGSPAEVINERLLDEVFELPSQPRRVMAQLLACAEAP